MIATLETTHRGPSAGGILASPLHLCLCCYCDTATPPPTPSPPRSLAPMHLQQLQSADWGSSQRREMWPAGVGGTARSLSLTPAAASPSAWTTTASAPRTSKFSKICPDSCVDLSVGTCFKMNVTINNSIPC